MTDHANWQQNYKFERTDPNLNEDFLDYLADHFPNAMWSTTYIHWHSAVGEYCVYINDKWKDYVPEEYIFKAGFEHYKTWINAWERSNKVELITDLTRHHVQTCIEFCEKPDSEIHYINYVYYFVRTIKNDRIMDVEEQKFAIKFLKTWLEKNDFLSGSDYLEGILNELESQSN